MILRLRMTGYCESGAGQPALKTAWHCVCCLGVFRISFLSLHAFFISLFSFFSSSVNDYKPMLMFIRHHYNNVLTVFFPTPWIFVCALNLLGVSVPSRIIATGMKFALFKMYRLRLLPYNGTGNLTFAQQHFIISTGRHSNRKNQIQEPDTKSIPRINYYINDTTPTYRVRATHQLISLLLTNARQHQPTTYKETISNIKQNMKYTVTFNNASDYPTGYGLG